MDTAQIEARIRDQVKALRHVGSSVDIDALLGNTAGIPVPAAVVVHIADQPHGASEFTGRQIQQVTSRFAVVFVLDNRRGALGAEANPALEQLRKAVRRALLGWAPEEAVGPLQAGPGSHIDFVNARLWWGVEYAMDHHWSEQ